MLLGFPCDSAGKESACNAGDLGSISGLERSPGEGKGYPLQYSSLENSMDCMVHGVTESRTQLSHFHFHFLWASLVTQRVKHLPAMWETWVWSLGQEDPLEKEMATHYSILAWRIPWMEEPGGLQSTGSQRVGNNWELHSLNIYSKVWKLWVNHLYYWEKNIHLRFVS